MESLIRLRLLTSQLKQNELHNFIQQIIKTFGAEKIISFIFNHFLLKYNQSQQHHDDLGNIINMISNILNSRKNTKTDEENDEDILPLSMDSMPSEMIKECASYLDVVDYLNFSKTNRKVYVSCNSPSKLHRLFTTDHPKYYECNLNKFISIKYLQLIPNQFNKYIASHPKQRQFHQLNTLYLNNEWKNNYQEIETFMNMTCIDFASITHLICIEFGDDDDDDEANLYDFDSFCDILLKFPNVTGLYMNSIFLTEFNAENKKIDKLLPNLSILEICDNVSTSVNLLRDKLINTYSKQIVSLTYDEYEIDIPDVSFPKLMELVLYDPKLSISKIIETTQHLERFRLSISISERIHDVIPINNMMSQLFTKYPKLQLIELSANYKEMQKLMDGIEIALFETKEMDREQITLSLTIKSFNVKDILMNEVNLYISRIINALDTSNINHYMVLVHVYIKGDNVFHVISDRLKATHLVNTAEMSSGCQSVIISNKECKINGYRARWINKELSFFC